MKAWQIFAVGVTVIVAALFLPIYEPILAGIAAGILGLPLSLVLFYGHAEKSFTCGLP